MKNRYFIIEPYGYGTDERFLEVKDIEEAKEIIGEKNSYEVRDYILDNYNGPDNCGFYLNDSELSVREVDKNENTIAELTVDISTIRRKNIPTQMIEVKEDANYIYLKEEISGSFGGIKVTTYEDFDLANLILKSNYSTSGRITVYSMDYKNAVEVDSYDNLDNNSDIDYGYIEGESYIKLFEGHLSLTICNESEDKCFSIPMPYNKIYEIMENEKRKLLALITENSLSQERLSLAKDRLSDIENGFNLDTIVIYDEDEFNNLIENSQE